MIRSVLLLGVALLMVPFPARADAAPLAVTALDLGADAVVAWVPGESPAEAYRVYGVRGGALEFLVQVPTGVGGDDSLLVPGDYDTYAVTGVVGSEESAPTFATRTHCVVIATDPPGASVGVSCITEPGQRARAVFMRA